MLKKIKIILVGIATIFILAAPVAVVAAPSDAVCEGIGAATDGGGCEEAPDESTVNGLVSTVVNLLSWIIGVAAVIMVMYGGFKYITAGGDSGKLASARSTIIYALIGIVIASLAQALVFFVLNRSSRTNNSAGNNTTQQVFCEVDSRGNFVSNPSRTVPCAMP